MKTETKKDDRVSNNEERESCQSTINPSEWKGRTIEIDDAGTGDLLGNAFIGLRDTSTEKIIFQSVPVDLYKDDEDNNKHILEPKKHILKVVIKALRILNHNDSDRILLCRGNCFDLVREYFEENGIYYEPAVVEGVLQDAVEGRFIQHLRKLGIKSSKLTTEAGFQRYFVMFNWICQDFPNRERYVKTGFPSWEKKWRKIAMERYQKSEKGQAQRRELIEQRANEIFNVMFENSISARNSVSERR